MSTEGTDQDGHAEAALYKKLHNRCIVSPDALQQIARELGPGGRRKVQGMLQGLIDKGLVVDVGEHGDRATAMLAILNVELQRLEGRDKRQGP